MLTCMSCDHLQHTSPTQVFWRCRWHCENRGGAVTRCHVKPESPTCARYRPRAGMPSDGGKALSYV